MNKKTVMMGLMVKNGARWLPTLWEQLKKLTYPKENVRIVVEYGKSRDNTLKLLKRMAKEKVYKIEIYREPNDSEIKKFGTYLAKAIWHDWQKLLKEDYFLLMDCDLVELPEDLIQQLMKVKADIVAPYIWSEKHRHFYDTFMFRINNMSFSPNDPPGMGLDKPIEVDSVGTVFLANREVFLSSKITNPYPHITLCINARVNGYKVVACPFIEVIHKDLEKLGIFHKPAPPRFGLYPSPGLVTSKFPVKVFNPNKKEEVKKVVFDV